MNILNTIAGMMGGNEGDTTSYQAILSWINEQGGVSAILDKFRKEGLGEVIESWLSNRDNLPVSASQILLALGSPAITALAGKLGVDSLSASTLLATWLPKIVDGLSPKGEVDSQQDLVTAGMNLLKGKLFG
ncbi:YidB family protein [Enterobacteriaceae bacterium C34A]